MLKKLFVVIAFATVCISLSYAQDHNQQDKIYIQPGQIHLGKQTLRVEVDGHMYDMSAIHRDIRGIYIVPNEEYTSEEFPQPYCNNGHRSPRKDGFCAYPGCPFNR